MDSDTHLYLPHGQMEGMARAPCGFRSDHQWPGGGHQLGGALGSSFQKSSSSELPVFPRSLAGWTPGSELTAGKALRQRAGLTLGDAECLRFRSPQSAVFMLFWPPGGPIRRRLGGGINPRR